jgi:hypothetical protein
MILIALYRFGAPNRFQRKSTLRNLQVPCSWVCSSARPPQQVPGRLHTGTGSFLRKLEVLVGACLRFSLGPSLSKKRLVSGLSPPTGSIIELGEAQNNKVKR